MAKVTNKEMLPQYIAYKIASKSMQPVSNFTDLLGGIKFRVTDDIICKLADEYTESGVEWIKSIIERLNEYYVGEPKDD